MFCSNKDYIQFQQKSQELMLLRELWVQFVAIITSEKLTEI